MPNTGKPSRDCYLCRARRVKCDLNRPECTRCINYGKTCPGYREPLDLVFQNEDVSSLGKTHGTTDRRRTASREARQAILGAKSRSSTVSTAPGSSDSLTSSEERWRTPLSFPPTASLDDHAVPLVLEQYSSRPPRSPHLSSASRLFGYHDFLPRMLQNQKRGCLKLVVDAFADGFLRNGSNDTWNTSYRSSEAYGKALRAVNESLRDPKMVVRDATLASVWLLANYEILTASPIAARPASDHHSRAGNWKRAPTAWYLHAQGMAYILRDRGVRQFSTRQGRDLFWAAFSIIQISYILSDETLPEDSRAWLDAVGSSLQSQDVLPFFVGRHTYYATTLINRMNGVLRDAATAANSTAHSMLKIVSEARGLEVMCGLAGMPAGEHPNVQFSTIYRMTTIKLHHCLILLINFVEDIKHDYLATEEAESLRAQRAASLHKIRRAADEILDTASMLFCSMGVKTVDESDMNRVMDKDAGRLAGVCWADALRLVPAVVLVGLLPSTNKEQKRRAKAALDVIGIQFRIRLATVQNYHVPPVPLHMRWREDKVEDFT